MTTTTAPATQDRAAPGVGAIALFAAVAYLVLTGIQITNPTFDDNLTTPTDYANDGSFFAGLVLSAAALWGLRSTLGASLPAVIIASIGQATVAAGVSVALITGTSPAWFVALGLPGNLLAFIGFVWLGVWAWRRRAAPRWVAVLMMLSVPVGLLVAEVGGTIVPAVMWCAIGAQLLRRP